MVLVPIGIGAALAAQLVHPAAWVIFAILALAAWLFSSLTVVVEADHVLFYFGPGFWRKRISLFDISEVMPVRNKWWYGWGIHYTPHGWLYNVSGMEAVEITRTDGTSLRVGTDEPQELAAAIANALQAR